MISDNIMYVNTLKLAQLNAGWLENTTGPVSNNDFSDRGEILKLGSRRQGPSVQLSPRIPTHALAYSARA